VTPDHGFMNGAVYGDVTVIIENAFLDVPSE
jgi:hypothetical protein